MVGDFNKALYYHREALKIHMSQDLKSQKNLIKIATTLSDVGYCYLYNGYISKAKRVILQSLLVLDKCFLNKKNPKYIMMKVSINSRLDLLRSLSFAFPLEAKIMIPTLIKFRNGMTLSSKSNSYRNYNDKSFCTMTNMKRTSSLL